MKAIVVDANILVRGVFGKRVFGLLDQYDGTATFYCPDVCVEEARRYVPKIALQRSIDPVEGLEIFAEVSGFIQAVDRNSYEEHEEAARIRIAHRDVDDWPIVATALLLGCPVWTEDQDFFGSGVATWTRTVEVYLRDA